MYVSMRTRLREILENVEVLDITQTKYTRNPIIQLQVLHQTLKN